MDEDTHFGEEHSGMDELDYSQEDIEFALYSQIHFESHPDTANVSSYAEVENEDFLVNSFTYDVIGEPSSGFVFTPTTADTILQKCIRDKYDVGDGTDENTEMCFVSRKNKVNSSAIKKINNKDKANKDLENIKCKGSKSDTFAEELKLEHRKHKKKVGPEFGPHTRAYSENVNAHVIFVSSSESSASDSDDIYGILGEMSEEDSHFEMNVEQTELFAKAKDEDKWAVSAADSAQVQQKGGSKARYFKGGLRCYNCNQVGHLSKNCPQPKKMPVCSLCSDSEHTSRTCPNIFCHNCEEPGHDLRSCKAPRRLYTVCFRCKMNGHDQKKCPDIWRQFHLTTESGKLQQPDSRRKRRISLSCYNCGETGHWGHECEEDRSNRFLRVSTPFVCRYQMDKGFDDTSCRNDGWEEMGSKRRRLKDSLEDNQYSRPCRDDFEAATEKESQISNLKLNELRKLRSLEAVLPVPQKNTNKFDKRNENLERSVPIRDSTSCIDNYPIEMESGHIGPESKRNETGYCGDKLEMFKTALQSTMQMVPNFVPSRKHKRFPEFVSSKKEKRLPDFVSSKKQKLPDFISFKKGGSSNPNGRNNFDNLRITMMKSNINELDMTIEKMKKEKTDVNEIDTKIEKKKKQKTDVDDIDMKIKKKKKQKTDVNEIDMKIEKKKKSKADVSAENLKDKKSKNVGTFDGTDISKTVIRTKSVKSKNKRHKTNQDLLNTMGKYYDQGIHQKQKSNKNFPKCSTFIEEDFPRSRDLTVTFDSGDMGHSGSDVRKRKVSVNDNSSSYHDDLFSVQKLHKIKSKLSQGEKVSELQDDGDVDHQAFNNEWWNEKKKHKKNRNQRRKKNAKKRYGVSKSSGTNVAVDIN